MKDKPVTSNCRDRLAPRHRTSNRYWRIAKCLVLAATATGKKERRDCVMAVRLFTDWTEEQVEAVLAGGVPEETSAPHLGAVGCLGVMRNEENYGPYREAAALLYESFVAWVLKRNPAQTRESVNEVLL